MNSLRMVRYGLWAAIAALGLVSGWLLLQEPAREQSSGTAAVGAPFVLTAHTGEVFDSRRLAGKPYALFFGFTHCPEICPTTLFETGEMLKSLGEPAKDFQVLFVSVDPERDTPNLLKDYLSAFDPRITGLTGTPEQIAAVARSHRAIYRKVETPSGYTMDHTAAVYLFDVRGRFVSTYDHSEPMANQKAKVERLLKG